MIKSEWFKGPIVDNLNVPDKNFEKSKVLINFGNKEHESKYVEIFNYNNKTDIFNIDEFEHEISESDLKLIKTLETKISKLEDKKLTEKEASKLQGLETRLKNVEYRTKNIIKTKKIRIFPNKKQKQIIKCWKRSAITCYNKCVQLYNDDNKYFDKGYMAVKKDIFEKLYGDEEKDCPFDILTSVIMKFCANLGSCRTALANRTIDHFKFKPIEYNIDFYTFTIPKKSVVNGSIYPRHLKKIDGLEKIKYVENDSSLMFSSKTQKYYISIPKVCKRQKVKNRESVVGIDEGEAVFVAFHGENTFGKIGIRMGEIILPILGEIDRLKKVLHKGKNRNGNQLRNRNRIRKRVKNKYDRIKNYVKELHNKVALYLCRNFDKIILPKFEVQEMVKKIKNTKNHFKKIKKDEGVKEMKKQLKKYTRSRHLSRKIKRSMLHLCHYKFKQHLINKANEYGCILDLEADESYTTKACTYCGYQSDNIKNRIKICMRCKKQLDRDISASRNTLIKNINKYEINL